VAVSVRRRHPLAQAIVSHARARKLAFPSVSSFDSLTGKGVSGTVGGHVVLLGNARLLDKAGVDYSLVSDDVDRLRENAQTVMYLSVDGRLVGYVAVSDPVKATTPEAVRLLRESGIRIIMLTGDNPVTANAVAKAMSLDGVKAGVLPQDKYKYVQELQEQGRVVAMAGDGLTDAPALAQAPTTWLGYR
jgi:Cu2+-exporting ATPase